MRHIVTHYHEIALKGGNRIHFERQLKGNLKRKLGNLSIKVTREPAQIVAYLSEDADMKEALSVVGSVPGIQSYSPSWQIALNMDEIESRVLDVAGKEEFDSFKILTKRRSKTFRYNSMEINCTMGDAVVERYDKKVNLTDPDLTIKIEISDKYAYVSTETFTGVGGLPTMPKQRVISLLSGGFDSPVASYMMMKRGCEVVLCHFQNHNQMKCSVESKITSLAKQLSRYQIRTKLYIVPFADIQQRIIAKVKSKYRMLVYRRFMLDLAEMVAQKENGHFLITGDSLSQVASQTFENLASTYNNTKMHVFTPLIGMNKNEIIDISKKIGTYEISAQPYGDCCSYFLAKHPSLDCSGSLLTRLEEAVAEDDLLEKTIEKAVIYEY